MFGRLFPQQLTNAYQGSWIALWLFIPVLLVKTLMAVNFSGINPFIDVRAILQSVDGVPLDTFSADAATSVVRSASAWGAALLALCLFAWIVVFRYRAGLPLAITVMSIEQIVRSGGSSINAVQTLIDGSHPPNVGTLINLAMNALLLAALILSALKVRPFGSIDRVN